MISDIIILARDYWKTLTRPLPKTFVAIASNAHGRLLLSLLFTILITEIAAVTSQIYFKYPIEIMIRYGLEGIILIPFLLLLWVFFVFKISKDLFRSQKIEYEMLLYALTVIVAVFELFSLILLPITWFFPILLNGINWAVWVYMFGLASIAVVGLAKLSGIQSIITIVLSAGFAAVGGLALFIFFSAIIRTVPFLM